LGTALIQRHESSLRHEWVPITRSACRWKSERQAKKSIVRAKCDLVVDVRIEAAGDGGMQIQELDLSRCHWIAKACQRTDTSYLYISSSRVFSGQLARPYREDDEADTDEPVGLLFAKAEQLITQACERHLVLRLGPIFSSDGANIITRMLEPLNSGDSLILDDNLRGCPVAAEDGARVIMGLLDQLSTGLEPWGIYHYGSSDTATYYEFAEAMFASASQFFDVGVSSVQLEREPEGMRPLNRSLDCTKLLNTFAIQQTPWRSAVADIVKHYFELHREDPEHVQA